MAEELKSWDGRPLDWRNKPTDRFLLRWIKRYLSAPVTLFLRRLPGVTPGRVTAAAAALGTVAGIVMAGGYGWQAGVIAAAAQIIDGVDGQLARLTGRESRLGAYLDSLLDRLADGAMVVGTVIYLLRAPLPYAAYPPAIVGLGFVAVVASNLVSYSEERARGLKLTLPPAPTLASKGTRTTVMVLCAFATPLWAGAPLLALAYLAVHPPAAVINRLLTAGRGEA